MRVAVIGTGHVGLVTAVAMAAIGHDVVGTDTNAEKVSLLQRGIPPYYEPGLEQALEQNMAAGRLSFAPTTEEAVREAEIVFICVSTPPRPDGEANLLHVERSAADVARHAPDGTVVVDKSTVPAGTADRVRQTLHREGNGSRFEVASNPEFLREGTALHDSLEPDRIVIGVESDTASRALRRLYEPLVQKGCRLIETDIPTAELAKHAGNAFLALKISFANAMARVCERAGADVTAVADVMGADPRIGRAFLNAGLGYGGSCFPKDVAALERLAARLGYDFPLLREVDALNRQAIEATAQKVEEAVWNLEGKRLALLGLSFKPGTDDVRVSPALTLARRLLTAGAHVVGYDPQAGPAAQVELPELEIAGSPYEAAAGAHCLVVATDWEEFGKLDLASLREVMLYPIVVDGRNVFDPDDMRRGGFSYYPTGRPPILHDLTWPRESNASLRTDLAAPQSVGSA
ncbi:MAG TPA: UDP-glucose/GDP-mannose dehydrogenase family protein [Actinomycetota bacterium]|nr:UDP-glucose/GDP-mannose dehydrogenase family protein [Actinomycetota bacterium]